MNMQGLLKQAQKMQKELAQIEKRLEAAQYEETMGGGAVKVVVKGSLEIESISIDEDLLNAEGKEDLEEMVKSAINKALEKAKTDKEKKMNAVTGGIKMPGGF